MAKSKKQTELEQTLGEITLDLQRTRADFENYRKRVEQEKAHAKTVGASSTILKILPTIDNIERAIGHLPSELKDNSWAQSVVKLSASLGKSLESMGLKRIDAKPGTIFDPNFHEAIQFDEESEGDKEVIAEELQAGYLLDGYPIRHAMVKVTKK